MLSKITYFRTFRLQFTIIYLLFLYLIAGGSPAQPPAPAVFSASQEMCQTLLPAPKPGVAHCEHSRGSQGGQWQGIAQDLRV